MTRRIRHGFANDMEPLGDQRVLCFKQLEPKAFRITTVHINSVSLVADQLF